ncbi:MAG: ABC transporter substrate-binding protein [Bacteroidia bacterium]|nr:ABC transporter substrate-binding protein [Bacteroidia bacterium]MDW8347078.1 ABC transporter substrate-binding protein [Bacteroidia bacterium]
MKNFGINLFILSILALLQTRCSDGEQKSNPLKVKRVKTMIKHERNEPKGLNPITTADATSIYIHQLLFDKLIDLNYETLELDKKVLCQDYSFSNDNLTLTFTLKPNIHFADNQPITAEDVVFTVKCIVNPLIDAQPKRADMKYLKDCVAKDKQTIVFTFKKVAYDNLFKVTNYLFILPKHIYDKQNLSDKYTVAEAIQAWDKKIDEPLIAKFKPFAEHFSKQEFNRDPNYILGSGRYVVKEWDPGKHVMLVKNLNYWNRGSKEPNFIQGMDTLYFKIITDVNAAFIALKSGEIDFSDHFKPSQMQKDMEDPFFKQNFDKRSEVYPKYTYIGWNMNVKGNPDKNFFADKKVRQAMAHLIDAKMLKERVLYGMAEPIKSMVFFKRPEYNKNLPDIPFDVNKAKQLLSEAGWKDTDNNGWIDKEINGKRIDFRFELAYPNENDVRKNIAMILQPIFKQAGIELTPRGYDWGAFLDRCKNHELEAWIGGWVYDANEQDLYSVFHSSQIDGGYNYGCYQSKRADDLLSAIPLEIDTQKRHALHKELQAVLHEEQPYTMLFAETSRIAYNKRLSNEKWYVQRPTYDIAQFYPRSIQPN